MDDSIVDAYYAKVPGASYDSSQGGYTYACSTTLPSFTVGIGNYKAVIPGSYMNYAPASGNSKSPVKSPVTSLLPSQLHGMRSVFADKVRVF